MNNFFSNLWRVMKNPRSEVISTSEDLNNLLLTFGLETWAGIDITPDQAMQYAPFATAVRVISEGCSQLPFNIFVHGSKDDRDREVATDFHIQQRFRRPNSWQTGIEFRDWNFRHAASIGNAFSLINRVRGKVTELLPLAPGRVRAEQRSDWSIVYHVTTIDGQIREFDADRIFHFRGPSDDGLTGMNMIKKHRQAIALGIAQDRCASNLFSKGAVVSGLFTVPGKLTDPQRDKFNEEIKKNFSGENIMSWGLLEGGADFKSMTMTSEAAQLLESRRLQRGIVGSLLRIPLHMLGDLDKATFSNIMNLARQAVDYTFMPWLVRFESAVEQQLMTERERESHFAKHNVNSLLRGDPDQRSKFYASAIEHGWMSPNEAREKEDMNSYEGGDEFQVAENLFGKTDGEANAQLKSRNGLVKISKAK